MPLAEDLGIEDVEEVVTSLFGLEGQNLGNGEFRILCPVHEQDGLDHSPSCDVNLRTGQWNCFSCSASSDLVGLGKIVLGKTRREVLDLLRPNEPTAIAAAIRNRIKTRQRKIANHNDLYAPAVSRDSAVPIAPLGSYESGPLDSLIERGFKKKTLKRWGIRFVREMEMVKTNGDSFTIRKNVAIPIVGRDGSPVAWCYRATSESDNWQIENAKYIYTAGVTETLSQNWFGLHRHRNQKEIVVVEGALDAMWCDQNGIPAVAMLGTSSKQFEKTALLTQFQRVTILPDRDAPGLIAALKLGDRLQSFGTPVRIALYRPWMTSAKGKPASDPQELSPIDLELAVATASTWHEWRRKSEVRDLADQIRRKEEGKELGRSTSR